MLHYKNLLVYCCEGVQLVLMFGFADCLDWPGNHPLGVLVLAFDYESSPSCGLSALKARNIPA